MLRGLVVLVVALALVSCGATEPTPDPARDKAAIEAALRQWPNDFNAKNVAGVCGLFADDVVLAYTDSEDRDHRQFCDQMKGLLSDPTKRFSYAEPDIREVLVDGDLATVRLFWTLTATDPSGKVLDTTVEDGVDVFTRQADGSWKIHVSHAFTK